MLSTLIIPFLLPAAYAQLNTLAKAAGLKYFGTATDNPEITDTAFVAVLSNSSEFGQITPGNTQKWDTTEPSNGAFSFTEGDVITTLATTNSQMLRCHNLVWYAQLPSWVSGGTWTNSTLQAVMTTHITTEVTHYKGQCYAWDVVNEALTDAAAFRTDLYYNDYNIETAGSKATAVINIVKTLQAAGTKIDGVGLQGHFIVGSSPTKAALVSAMQAYTTLGVEVALTELDIRMTLPSTDALLAQQSTDYENAVAACVAVTDCVGVTVWDFDDKYSWVPGTFSGQGAACLFDNDLNRKPAYYGVVSALSGGASTVISSTVKATPTPSGLTTSYINTSNTTTTASTPSVSVEYASASASRTPFTFPQTSTGSSLSSAQTMTVGGDDDTCEP